MNIPGPRRQKHGQPHGDVLARILAPSVLAICVCTLCLCGTTWAWFTATASSGTAVLQSSSYKLAYQTDTTDAAATDFTETAVVAVPADGQCGITLSATGTEGAAGYCSVQVGNEVYYTEPIFVGGDSFSFTVTGDPGAEIQLTPKWGSYTGDPNLSSGDTIGNTTGNTQQENPVAAATTTEPTTPSAAPSSSPEESAASTPDTPADSATAQPEGVTGGEQAPAPEDSNR